ncbi:MAG: YbaB/EbfC family nucleoid-associated protein [Tepidisphaeraceae bacterium]
MFDALKQLKDLPGMMARAKEFQAKVKDLQEDLGTRQFSSDAGAGMVTAIVNGRLELVKMKIDAARLGVRNSESGKVQIGDRDVEMLEDLVCAAVRSAQRQAAEMMQSEMKRLATEAGLPDGAIPGM